MVVAIRRYRAADQPDIRTLHDRTPPAGQPATGPQPWPQDLDRIPTTYLAFWVAVAEPGGTGQVVGMVGLLPPDAAVLQAVGAGRERSVQLKRMRVAPEWQRRGIGRRLLQTAIAWARSEGYERMLLETTAEQAAAIALYRAAGFLPVGTSMAGAYTLLWFELPPTPVDPDRRRGSLQGQP
jgi:GNAT superfamily N-acetyltransferase